MPPKQVKPYQCFPLPLASPSNFTHGRQFNYHPLPPPFAPIPLIFIPFFRKNIPQDIDNLCNGFYNYTQCGPKGKTLKRKRLNCKRLKRKRLKRKRFCVSTFAFSPLTQPKLHRGIRLLRLRVEIRLPSARDLRSEERAKHYYGIRKGKTQ